VYATPPTVLFITAVCNALATVIYVPYCAVSMCRANGVYIIGNSPLHEMIHLPGRAVSVVIDSITNGTSLTIYTLFFCSYLFLFQFVRTPSTYQSTFPLPYNFSVNSHLCVCIYCIPHSITDIVLIPQWLVPWCLSEIEYCLTH
jgi:hypothetical protein